MGESLRTQGAHVQKCPATTGASGAEADTGSDPAYVSTLPIDQLVLGELTGWDLPHPLLALWLHGLFTGQADAEQLRAEVRRLDALDASRPPRDVQALLRPTFAELSRIRGEHERAERADRASQRRGAA